ncbi:MAG: 50S ribosomal protein L2 [Patescibacteria group bacterium]
MALRIYKPTSPARRQTSVDTFSDVTVKRSLRPRTKINRKNAGRNNTGKITVRHQGGGTRRYYREIDFKRDKFDIEGRLSTIEYDPNRSTRIGAIFYKDGEKRYILVPQGLKIGDLVISSKKAIKPEIGYCMPLEFIPVGLMVHNIELNPGQGGGLARSAGSYAQLMGVEGAYAQLKLPSSEVRLVTKECLATVGTLSNPDHRHVRLGKAGRKRLMGIRPSVRGKAMNPVDHPHGGGEGLSPIGLKHPKTPWGKPALGHTTRKVNRRSTRLILKRRKK